MMSPGISMEPSPFKRPDWWCRKCGYRWMGARQMDVPGPGGKTLQVLGYWCERCRKFFPLPAKEQAV